MKMLARCAMPAPKHCLEASRSHTCGLVVVVFGGGVRVGLCVILGAHRGVYRSICWTTNRYNIRTARGRGGCSRYRFTTSTPRERQARRNCCDVVVVWWWGGGGGVR